MATSDEEEEPLLRSVALQNAHSILLARERAESELLEAREALRESRERLTAALAAASTGTFRWVFASGTNEWDEMIGPLFGMPAAQGTHRFGELLHTLHPEDRPVVQSRMQQCRLDGSPFDMEFRVVHPGGALRWLAMKAIGGVRHRRYADLHDRRLPRRDAAEGGRGGAARGDADAGDPERDRHAARRSARARARAAGGHRCGHGRQRRRVRRLLLQRHQRRRRSLPALHGVGRAARGVRAFRPAARDRPVRADLPRRSADPHRRRARRSALRGRWARTAACRPAHPPVRSYLAVAVRSRSGEVLGGLFFGHPDPGVFTERAERLVLGVASQAGVALDNARLYEQAQRAAAERKALLDSERAARAEAERVSEHQGRLPRHAVARAAHAAERHPRLGPGAAHHQPQRRRAAGRPRDHRTQRARPGAAHRRSARHEPHQLGQAPARGAAAPPDLVHRGGDRDGDAGRRRQGHPGGAHPRSGCRTDRRRSRPPAAGRVEPALERHQVHAGGRHRAGGAAAARCARRDRGRRQRHRHPAGADAAPVRALPPGRRLDHAPVRRPRARPVAGQEPRRAARRHRRRDQCGRRQGHHRHGPPAPDAPGRRRRQPRP